MRTQLVSSSRIRKNEMGQVYSGINIRPFVKSNKGAIISNFRTIKRSEDYQGHLNLYLYEDSSAKFVTGDGMLKLLGRTTDDISKDKLVFASKDIGTQSARSEATMEMVLDNTTAFLIMLVNRQRTDAFLKYVLKQVF